MIIRRLALAILLIFVISLSTTHAARADTTINVRAAADLNLHNAPAIAADVIAVVPGGSILTAVARDVTANWVLVDFAGLRGWLYVPFLVTSGPVTTLPATNNAAFQTPSGGAVTATALFRMSIRGGPGRQYQLLGFLHAGDSVVLDGKTFGWYRYNFAGITKGWLIKSLVQVQGDASTLPDVTWPPYGDQFNN